ncbi:MAG: helix-turn-helix domain-containing protein [Eubacterium sp.]
MAEYVKTELAVLDKAAFIIDCAAEDGSLSIAELQKALMISRSSVYRFLASLETHGWLEREGGGKYRLGWKLTTLAGMSLNEVDLIRSRRVLWTTARRNFSCRCSCRY